MASGRLVDYIGKGVIADRPASLTLTTGAMGLYYATDTGALSVWDGSAWQTPTIVVPDETIDDRVAALLVAGTGITLTYNDGANTLTVDSTITQYTDEMARDALGLALTAGTNITITPNDGSDTITIDGQSDASIMEKVRDMLATSLVAGTNVTITPDDGADTITIAASGGGGGGASVLDDLTDVDTTTTPPTAGDALVFDGTNWVPEALESAVGLKGLTLLSKTSAQTIAGGVWVDVTWDSEIYDNLGAFTPSSATITVPSGVGWVRVTGFLPWANSATGDRLMAIIRASGTGPGILSGMMQSPKNESFHSFKSAWIAVVPGDTYKMQLHAGGASVDIGNVSFGGYPQLQLEWLSSISDVIGTANNAATGGGALELIQETITAGSQTTVDFTNIPATYRDLVLVVRGRGTAAAQNANVNLRFNGDSGASQYAYQLALQSNGTAISGAADDGDPEMHIGYISAATGFANGRGTTEATIYDYANTTYYKNVISDGGLTNDGTVGQIFRTEAFGYWKSVAAINQVTVLLSTGGFVDGSIVSLYGRTSAPAGVLRPWWWQPPTAADFTAVSGDATLPTKSDDPYVGMILSNGSTVAGPTRRIVHKALPSGVSWTATGRFVFDGPTMNYIGAGLMAYETSSGRILDIMTIPSVDGTNRLFLDTHGGATSLTVGGSDLAVTREGAHAMWFRIVHDHAADTYQTFYSHTGKSWLPHITATTAATLGITHYDKIGFGFLNFGTGASEAYLTCDHFVIT